MGEGQAGRKLILGIVAAIAVFTAVISKEHLRNILPPAARFPAAKRPGKQ
jgi:hypothetical protein